MKFRKDWANACLMGYSHLCPYCPGRNGRRRVHSPRPPLRRFQCLQCGKVWDYSFLSSALRPPFDRPLFVEVEQ